MTCDRYMKRIAVALVCMGIPALIAIASDAGAPTALGLGFIGGMVYGLICAEMRRAEAVEDGSDSAGA